jgi:hypothetical protein
MKFFPLKSAFSSTLKLVNQSMAEKEDFMNSTDKKLFFKSIVVGSTLMYISSKVTNQLR